MSYGWFWGVIWCGFLSGFEGIWVEAELDEFEDIGFGDGVIFIFFGDDFTGGGGCVAGDFVLLE